MPGYADRIKPTDYHIHTYLEDLLGKNYQIPTFQREIVWERNSVKKLWDSIYRFYPIGSILVWKTDLKLQNHRAVGGHVIASDDRNSFQYILDGQQRTTALLTSLYGGKIEGMDDFDPTLYFDLTVEDQDETDGESHKQRFLFWDEIDASAGGRTQNVPRMNRYRQGLIVRLREVMQNFSDLERKLVDGEHKDYDDPIRARLRRIRDVLDNYRLSFIELKGITVPEVCQIFERINQEGKPLDIFDIVVAKTFRIQTDTQPGFYLRELVDGFRNEIQGNFSAIDDLTVLQILATIIRDRLPDAQVLNITPLYLNRIRTEHVESIWEDAVAAMRRLFDFFDNHLHLKGPRLIPYRYFYLTIARHFFDNQKPNYDFLKKYFWYYSFHNEDLLRNTTHLQQHVALLSAAREPGAASLERFLIDRARLRASAYSTRGRLSSAILSLFANQMPRDWKQPDRHVLTDVYYVLTDKPNLHHIFPMGYTEKHPGTSRLDSNSLMNIAYLTQITNLEISDKNPVQYLREYDGAGFEQVLQTHLVPLEILEWSRQDTMPSNGLDLFIEARIDLIIADLKKKLDGVTFDVIDTKEEAFDSQ